MPPNKKVNGVYGLHKKEYIRYFPHIKNRFSHIDYEKGKGVLLSTQSWNKDYVINLIDPNTGAARIITKGSQAFWGPQGDIYFTRGSGQLWRCELDNPKEKPVYLATMFPRNEKHLSTLWLSDDRSFIVFNYAVPLMAGGTQLGVLFVDLDEKEYLHVEKGMFHPTSGKIGKNLINQKFTVE